MPGRSANYFFLTFWVSADAAADLAALLAVLLRRILEAEEATLALVVSVLPFCVRADAATDFSALVAVLLFRTFEADDATFLLVLSDFAMGGRILVPRTAEVRADEAAPCQIRKYQGIVPRCGTAAFSKAPAPTLCKRLERPVQSELTPWLSTPN
jgi:hypothetical protein